MTELPTTLDELIALILTNVVALGAASALLTAGLFKFLKNYIPGAGWEPAENWKRLISWVVPFLIAGLAFEFTVWQGTAHNDPESIYGVLRQAFMVIAGKQLFYIGGEAVRSVTAPKADERVIRRSYTGELVENVAEGPHGILPPIPESAYGPNATPLDPYIDEQASLRAEADAALTSPAGPYIASGVSRIVTRPPARNLAGENVSSIDTPTAETPRLYVDEVIDEQHSGGDR